MSTPTWIDCEFARVGYIGYIGYVVETLNTNNGGTTWSIRERPCHTNQSNQPRLHGWCGETDNRSRYARGVAKVTAVNAAGTRVRLARLEGAELLAFLERDGYPELAP